MPITLGTNIASLQSQRRLSQSSDTIARVYERLSSGMRINRASDDAAGLAIATKLNSDARVFTQAIRNINDGISLISIAQGALSALSSIVMRQKELAEQAANGTYTFKQRNELDREADALVKEYNRIIQSTSFNGMLILDGSGDDVRLQHGFGSTQSTSLNIGGELGGAAGSGTFTLPVSIGYSFGNFGGSIVAGDVDGDGNMDIIASTSAGFYGVEIFFGVGDGTFRSQTYIIQESTGGYSINTGDFNGDGNLDILDAGGTIFLGNGDGTFQFDMAYTGFYGNGLEVLVDDFNSDGISDLASGGMVYIGNGDGTFRRTASMAATSNDRSASGDVNGDGFSDIVISRYGGDSVDILIGNGDGTFRYGQTYATENGPYDMLIDDFNDDGVLDIATSHVGTNTLDIRLGNGDGSFQALRTVSISSPTGIVSGDFNDDGIVDIASVGYIGTNMSILLGNGDGTFRAGQVSSVGTWAFTLLATDLNNDGVEDLAFTTFASDGLQISLGEKDPTGRQNNLMSRYDLTTLEGAREAIESTTAYLDRINAEIGSLGAMESRINFVARNLSTMRENYLAAGSRIIDADIAEESAQLIRAQILQQAAAAILAQANQQPEIALMLIKSG